jgi:hypothetical protein
MEHSLLNTCFNGLTAFGAILTAAFALIGLFTWRQQLYGQTNLNLAIELGKAVATFVDKLQELRWRMKQKTIPELRKEYAAMRAELQRSLITPEVVWGKSIARIRTELESCAGFLFATAGASYRLNAGIGSRPPTPEEAAEQTRLNSIIYGDDDPVDILTVRINAVVEDMTRTVKPHLPKQIGTLTRFKNWLVTFSPDLKREWDEMKEKSVSAK